MKLLNRIAFLWGRWLIEHNWFNNLQVVEKWWCFWIIFIVSSERKSHCCLIISQGQIVGKKWTSELHICHKRTLKTKELLQTAAIKPDGYCSKTSKELVPYRIHYNQTFKCRISLSQCLTKLMHKICFTISFISCLYMFRAHVLIIRRSKLHYTASGIIKPIGVMISEAWNKTYCETNFVHQVS